MWVDVGSSKIYNYNYLSPESCCSMRLSPGPVPDFQATSALTTTDTRTGMCRSWIRDIGCSYIYTCTFSDHHPES